MFGCAFREIDNRACLSTKFRLARFRCETTDVGVSIRTSRFTARRAEHADFPLASLARTSSRGRFARTTTLFYYIYVFNHYFVSTRACSIETSTDIEKQFRSVFSQSFERFDTKQCTDAYLLFLRETANCDEARIKNSF